MADEESALSEEARRYARLGATLVVHVPDPEQKTTGARTTKRGITSLLYTGKLSTMSDVEHLLDAVVRTHGKVDLVIDAAGHVVQRPGSAQNTRATDDLLAYAIFVHIQQQLIGERYREESRKLLLGRA
ncbi:hypothetical protein LTR78_006180 [Recurvomyces mirabilis]|uniref:Uncharacterized protein n=1 Tax=Recurvomyces mirabilis TaxID=574656 RepID=A0AAE0WLL1_9PEZI|nr:hypothetical protein LTR78_006180 [Recurvomyces mirabilis]KAK5152022.1 hypothetical protein LTS14_008796 [Recurvomyces mirabilis]